MPEHFDLETTFVNVLGGDPCSIAELEQTELFANSEIIRDAVHANGILLYAGSLNQRQGALVRLGKLIREDRVCDADAQFRLLTAFVQARVGISGNPIVQEFVLKMSSAPQPEIRGNSIILLKEIAQFNPRAIDALKHLSSDSDETVRHNATTLLRLVKSEEP